MHGLNEGERPWNSCKEPLLAIDDDPLTFVQHPITLEEGTIGKGDGWEAETRLSIDAKSMMSIPPPTCFKVGGARLSDQITHGVLL